MINWTEKELLLLKKYYEEKMKEANEEIKDSSFPPDQQTIIDESQNIIWLIKDMMNERSWVYKLCNKI